MTERKIICKIRIGSHLYGTNRPDSDEDFCGVFLPSENDLHGLQSCPSEMSESVKVSTGPRNEKGDVDCKFYSLQRFINLAGQGQPGVLEMLFAPAQSYIFMTDEWSKILDHLPSFLSRKSVVPFIGFSLAQASKTSLKGDSLNQIRDILAWAEPLTNQELLEPLQSYMVPTFDNGPVRLFCERTKKITDWEFKLKENDSHCSCLWVAGRQYDPGAKLKVLLGSLKNLVGKYGTRSEAAATHGLDYKSLMHAYRLMGQAEELIGTGKITLPRPPEEVSRLLAIRNMELPPGFDWLADITARIDRLRTDIETTSLLRKEPDWSKLGVLCRTIVKDHLKR